MDALKTRGLQENSILIMNILLTFSFSLTMFCLSSYFRIVAVLERIKITRRKLFLLLCNRVLVLISTFLVHEM